MNLIMPKSAKIQIAVRPMRVADLAQVQAIDEISFSTPWPKNAYRFELLENPNGYCWVAEADGRLVAVIVCWLIVDEIHIATIAVSPDYRGLGIGKELVITGLRNLIRKGALSATLEVRAGNFVAQNLYRHFGFEVVGERRRYYQDNQEDALLMTVAPLDQEYLTWLDAGVEFPWGEVKPSKI
jgi:ribosomal-protein-alanine N-acetyltransferase